MLRALMEAGIRPDLMIGTSVGAVNAAWLAGRPDLIRLEQAFVTDVLDRTADEALACGVRLLLENHSDFTSDGSGYFDHLYHQHHQDRWIYRACKPVS